MSKQSKIISVASALTFGGNRVSLMQITSRAKVPFNGKWMAVLAAHGFRIYPGYEVGPKK